MTMSFREFWFQHQYKDGVLPNEYEQELKWAKERKLSMHHIRDGQDKDHRAESIATLVEHYGSDRLSKVQDSACGHAYDYDFLQSIRVAAFMTSDRHCISPLFLHMTCLQMCDSFLASQHACMPACACLSSPVTLRPSC